MEKLELEVLALGAWTPIGGAAQTAGAIAARMSRPAAVEWTEIDPDSVEEEPSKGHPAAELGGFAGPGRLARLVQLALEDLALPAPVPGAAPLPAVIVASDGEHLRAAAERSSGAAIDDQDWRQGWDAERRAAATRALSTHAAALGLAPEVLYAGRGALAAGLLRVRELLRASRIPRCVLVGVDSLVDPELLEALWETGTLKSPKSPAGIIPGEAAVAMLLADPRARAPGLVRLDAVASEDQPGERETAAALRACTAALTAERPPQALLADHNGEEWMARAYGTFLAATPALASVPSCFPAINAGDSGTASGFLALPAALGLARRSGRRRYLGTSLERGGAAAAWSLSLPEVGA